MNEIQIKITELQGIGWTLAAVAEELGVTCNAVEKWKAGDRHPANTKITLIILDRLRRRKQPPKRRRHFSESMTGSRQIGTKSS